jgi:insulysin
MSGSNYTFQFPNQDLSNPNNAVHISIYTCDYLSTQSRALSEMVAQVINEPCFDQLRTKETLGYIVHSGLTAHRGNIGIVIVVQSSEKEVIYVEERIEKFLESMEDRLKEMTEEEFLEHKESKCKSLEEDWKNMKEE